MKKIKKDVVNLRKYLSRKKKVLNAIEAKLKHHSCVYSLFSKYNWFSEVKRQIQIWGKNPKKSLKKREISIPEYELFRYLCTDSIFQRFLAAFDAIETITKSDKSRYGKWNSSKKLLFSKNVSQIYSSLFEILILGKLIASNKNVEPYYQNIDGRIKIDKRFIYFEIKSLQKSEHDLSGECGATSIEYDKKQIFRALREKAKQLYPYRNKPTIVFLSLYQLADEITGEISVTEYMETKDGTVISAVVMYDWFTAKDGKKVIINKNSCVPLKKTEISYLEGA